MVSSALSVDLNDRSFVVNGTKIITTEYESLKSNSVCPTKKFDKLAGKCLRPGSGSRQSAEGFCWGCCPKRNFSVIRIKHKRNHSSLHLLFPLFFDERYSTDSSLNALLPNRMRKHSRNETKTDNFFKNFDV